MELTFFDQENPVQEKFNEGVENIDNEEYARDEKSFSFFIHSCFCLNAFFSRFFPNVLQFLLLQFQFIKIKYFW